MKKLILLLTVLFGAANMSAQDNDIQEDVKALCIKKNGKWGYVDTSGKVIVPTIYDECHIVGGDGYNFGLATFNNGLEAVCKDGKWGYIDITGKVVIPFIYDYAENFNDGLATVEKDGKWGFIDKSGNVVTPTVSE